MEHSILIFFVSLLGSSEKPSISCCPDASGSASVAKFYLKPLNCISLIDPEGILNQVQDRVQDDTRLFKVLVKRHPSVGKTNEKIIQILLAGCCFLG
jgi:hypothetical protein